MTETRRVSRRLYPLEALALAQAAFEHECEWTEDGASHVLVTIKAPDRGAVEPVNEFFASALTYALESHLGGRR